METRPLSTCGFVTVKRTRASTSSKHFTLGARFLFLLGMVEVDLHQVYRCTNHAMRDLLRSCRYALHILLKLTLGLLAKTAYLPAPELESNLVSLVPYSISLLVFLHGAVCIVLYFRRSEYPER